MRRGTFGKANRSQAQASTREVGGDAIGRLHVEAEPVCGVPRHTLAPWGAFAEEVSRLMPVPCGSDKVVLFSRFERFRKRESHDRIETLVGHHHSLVLRVYREILDSFRMSWAIVQRGATSPLSSMLQRPMKLWASDGS